MFLWYINNNESMLPFTSTGREVFAAMWGLWLSAEQTKELSETCESYKLTIVKRKSGGWEMLCSLKEEKEK